MVEERWLPVLTRAGVFSNRYDVSDLGRVRVSLLAKGKGFRPGHILVQWPTSDGYLQVRVTPPDGKDTGLKVHRLVADAFMGGRPRGHHVNHIDGVKTNNSLSNLEFLSPKENAWHAARVISGRPHVVVNGERMSIPEAIHRYGVEGVSRRLVNQRINREGWSVERAISTPSLSTWSRRKIVDEGERDDA